MRRRRCRGHKIAVNQHARNGRLDGIAVVDQPGSTVVVMEMQREVEAGAIGVGDIAPFGDGAHGLGEDDDVALIVG